MFVQSNSYHKHKKEVFGPQQILNSYLPKSSKAKLKEL